MCPFAANFVDALAALHFDNTFNPYTDVCPEHDLVNGALIGRSNLLRVLEAAVNGGVDSIWIARDLGYRAGRRTGLAMTDEPSLAAMAWLFGMPALERATHGPELVEQTATVVWRTLHQLERRIFLWNVFPLHPHAANDPMSNRRHSAAEQAACRPLLLSLLDALRPRAIVAIGRDAQASLRGLDVAACAVRHPSHGGRRAFEAGIAAIYRDRAFTGESIRMPAE